MAALRAATPLTLREDDLFKLRGINERIDLDEVTAIYLPLSRLLNLYVSASQDLARVSSTFLGTMAGAVGSLASGLPEWSGISLPRLNGATSRTQLPALTPFSTRSRETPATRTTLLSPSVVARKTALVVVFLRI